MKTALPPSTVLQPHPVLIIGTYGVNGQPNLATASWGGICCGEPPCVAVSFRKATLTYHNIIHSKAFTIGIPSEKQAPIADYLGLVSGRNTDKFETAKLTAVRSALVNAPYAEEFSYSLECKLIHSMDLGLHTHFIAQIMGLVADPKVLTVEGEPDVEKTRPIVWGSHGSPFYFALGEHLGKTFTIGKNLFYQSRQ